MLKAWSVDSWRRCLLSQQPSYADAGILKDVEHTIGLLPGIVEPAEIDQLLQRLAVIREKGGLVMNIGDCAESMDSCNRAGVDKYLALVKDVQNLFNGCEFVNIGRIAGQLSKPRSSECEHRQGVSLPSYRGDMVNSLVFAPSARAHDPERLLAGYHYSARKHEHLKKAASDESLRYISHEALLLNYEQLLTRKIHDKYYCLSAHMVWVGNKTRFLGSAHLEYARGIANPVGIKIDDKTSVTQLITLLNILNPDNLPGKILLICRLGCYSVRTVLSGLVSAVCSECISVVWVCDPMHGNTHFRSRLNVKIRCLGDLLRELRGFLEVMDLCKVAAVGLSIESTAEEVLECCDDISVGGGHRFFRANSVSPCDPRMNRDQTLKLICMMRDFWGDRNGF